MKKIICVILAAFFICSSGQVVFGYKQEDVEQLIQKIDEICSNKYMTYEQIEEMRVYFCFNTLSALETYSKNPSLLTPSEISTLRNSPYVNFSKKTFSKKYNIQNLRESIFIYYEVLNCSGVNIDTEETFIIEKTDDHFLEIYADQDGIAPQKSTMLVYKKPDFPGFVNND